jgi:hypothetical protein
MEWLCEIWLERNEWGNIIIRVAGAAWGQAAHYN